MLLRRAVPRLLLVLLAWCPVAGRAAPPVRASSAPAAKPPAKVVPAPLAAAEPVGSRRLADRVLAAVDGDPILESDVRRAIGLGVVTRNSGEDDRALRRRVLDLEIAERLRFHEVDRLGFSEISPRAVEEAMGGFRARFASPAAFAERLHELGLTEDGLKQLVVRQLMALTYVEERLGARVFVSAEDIRAYYDATLAPEMKRRGQPLPPVDEVREEIRGVLREQRLNDEIQRWTEQLRRQADVVDNFESLHGELPPVVYEVKAGSDAKP